ncbi:uncharacterized protein JN550_013672 [Neoarthrinium moseri]|uniref:uncharacterized protein n=1 Tax=Neoarthrinium moseri TaxID=1658444 RepID=UPI001FDB8C5B|nr:uncharacterized protein JN550_013672 [Neoarthrinium moseri]KAI1856732.1 hypothetical protein JN550_013672 [Neoarthrinium moseri]
MNPLMLSALLVFVLAKTVHATYRQTCKNIIFNKNDPMTGGRPSLTADCPQEDNGFVLCTKLDLGFCYANLSGKLTAQNSDDARQGFGATCWDCVFAINTLQCVCPGPNNSRDTTTINTDELIDNNNGYLRCFNHLSKPNCGG